MVNMKLSLPPHRENRVKIILAGITSRQKHIGVKKWHQVIGEL